MAARYWIGGTGNWSDTAHWSATSGGVGGASVPTIGDDVYFDSNSGTGTITVNATANMRDCTFAQTQLITLANAAYAFNVYGNWTLCSNTYLATSFSGTGYVHLKATTSVNITSNGCTRAWNRIYFYGVGGTWTNQDDFSIGYTQIFHYAGTWDTNNYTITALISIVSDNVENRTLFFRNSTINVFDNFTIFSSRLTLDAGTSTINCTGNFMGASKSYHNVILSSDISSYISGENTFNNLTLMRGALSGLSIRMPNQIVNNELRVIGNNSSNFRVILSSSTIGTPSIITCNGTVIASNVDFRDIVGAGTANWDLSAIEGGSGDCGGNSGITFTPAQTQYFKHTSGAVNWSDATKWFSNYERTIQGRVPLPQDDTIFDENSFTGASTLNIDVAMIYTLDMRGVIETITIRNTNPNRIINFFGSVYLSDTIQIVDYQTWDFNFRNDGFLDLREKTLNIRQHFSVRTGKTVKLLSNLSGNWVVFALGYYNRIDNLGTFDCNGFALKSPNLGFGISGGNCTVKLGSATHEVANFAVNVTCTLEAQTSTIKLVNPSSSNMGFGGRSKVYNKVQFSGTGSGAYNVTGDNQYAEITIEHGRKVNFQSGTTQAIGKLTAIGTPDQPITIGSTTAGQRHTISYTGSEASTVEYCNISDSKVTQARRLLAKISVDAGNNQNWWFEGLPLLALNFGQVDKMYVGGSEVVNAYYGAIKIK